MKCSSHEEVKTLDNIYFFFLISNETYIHHEKNAKQPLEVFMMVNTKNSETKQQKKKKEKEKKLKVYF